MLESFPKHTSTSTWSDLPLHEESKKTSAMASYMSGRLSWLSRKGAIIIFAAFMSALCLFFISRQEVTFSTPFQSYAPLHDGFPTGSSECIDREGVASRQHWNAAEKKHRHLRDDKFTIAIQTYRRPERLNKTLSLLLQDKIPSLHEVVIVWNDLETPTPGNFVSQHNVTVRYRMSRRNSLNEKLWPDPAYQTKAILLSDDDVHYEPSDLDFVFQTWRNQGQNRLTGAFARCVKLNKDGKWEYNMCGGRDSYSLVLTGLAFTHISFLDYFSSEDVLMTKLREFVDTQFNCEDIALNYVASMLTCTGPLQVSGLKKPINEQPPQGISTKPGHMNARHKCVNDFNEFFGYMPLQNTTEFITRGYFPG